MNTVHASVIDLSGGAAALLADALKGLGIDRVDYFSSTAEAKAAFLANRADYTRGLLFVGDEPRLESEQFIRSVMADPDFSGLTVVLVTSKSDPVELLWAFKIGAVDYLEIPIHLPRLSAVISSTKYRGFRTA